MTKGKNKTPITEEAVLEDEKSNSINETPAVPEIVPEIIEEIISQNQGAIIDGVDTRS